MSAKKTEAEIIDFPKAKAEKTISSTERIWGKAVCSHGYAGIPSILIKGQRRLGLSPMQLNICIQLLDYWFDPARKPFPSKKDLAQRIGCTEKTVQNNVREMEKAGLIKRQLRKTAAGDWNSNIYHLDGLVEKVQALEPEFATERKERAERKTQLVKPGGLKAKSK
ncbi:helix-turn-helix domain-containing protein [Luteimonas gilva]|uniref:Helix-turn-helix domain-containing protein n=1 Tax=Luteimonas gilva TaxID=2572684 RepID=A0A4U5JNT9_9GAMM|nr:helix-turn-helix domain-containing protein [Luteimonas gilva]TKR30456.1 helix-turn-helix domain-containing protein [Luteimonas gilva]